MPEFEPRTGDASRHEQPPANDESGAETAQAAATEVADAEVADAEVADAEVADAEVAETGAAAASSNEPDSPVTAALAQLETLPGLELAQHPDVYQRIHGELQRALSTIDDA